MAKKSSEESELEDSFDTYWIQLGDGSEIERQYRGIVKRINKKGKAVMTNHRFDFAFPAEKLAIEIQGGIFSRGRHVRGKGYHDDRVKMRKAMSQGWLVLEYTTIDVKRDPASMIEEVNQFLAMRRKEIVRKEPIQLTLPFLEKRAAS